VNAKKIGDDKDNKINKLIRKYIYSDLTLVSLMELPCYRIWHKMGPPKLKGMWKMKSSPSS
jgi:hypothetical protein